LGKIGIYHGVVKTGRGGGAVEMSMPGVLEGFQRGATTVCKNVAEANWMHRKDYRNSLIGKRLGR
jgi:hypothetical protein